MAKQPAVSRTSTTITIRELQHDEARALLQACGGNSFLSSRTLVVVEVEIVEGYATGGS